LSSGNTAVAAAGAIVAAVLVLAATVEAAAPTAAAPPKPWVDACTYCHEAQIAPSLFGRRLEPAAIVVIVRNGLPAMPAFHRAEISDAELAALAAWIARQPPTAPSPPARSPP
jgi:cytochrome c553